MSEARKPLDSVVIVGAGQVGVTAAIAIRRALPACAVIVIAETSDPRDFADHAASAMPFSNRLLARLGIDETQIIARAGGSHRLVQRFFGWGGSGSHGALAYGAAGLDGLSAFGRDWGGGSRSVESRPMPTSLSEVLADAGRFGVAEQGERTPLAQVEYGLRWQTPAFHALLVNLAQQLGVTYRSDPVSQVDRDTSGNVAGVTLASGEKVEADLCLDCSGVSRKLASKVAGQPFVSWQRFLHDRTVMIAPPGQGMLALEDRLSLTARGWLSELAGRGGLQAMLGVADGVSPEEARASLGVEPVGTIEVTSGRLADAWTGNVIALGDAAAQFEPLGYFHLDLAHRMLDLLLEMLPGKIIAPVERTEFNRRAGLMMDGVRDVLAFHYAAPSAQAVFEPVEQPGSVAAMLDQFTRRGRLPFADEQPLTGATMQSLLRALGFAAGTPPQHHSGTGGPAAAARQAFEARARAALQAAPPYPEWIASQLR